MESKAEMQENLEAVLAWDKSKAGPLASQHQSLYKVANWLYLLPEHPVLVPKLQTLGKMAPPRPRISM